MWTTNEMNEGLHNRLMREADEMVEHGEAKTLKSAFYMMQDPDGCTSRDVGCSYADLVEWCNWAIAQVSQ